MRTHFLTYSKKAAKDSWSASAGALPCCRANSSNCASRAGASHRLPISVLLQGADFPKTLAQRFRKGRLDFRRDEPHSIEVLDVNLILQTETGQLHTDQVGDGADPDSFFRADWIG